MKKIILLTSLMALTISIKAQCYGQLEILSGYYSCNTYDEWVLVFEDQFNEDNLDDTRWRNNPPAYVNLYCGAPVYFTDGDNNEFNNGNLELIVKEESVYERAIPWENDNYILYCDGTSVGQNKRWWDYTSGMIHSKQKFVYGKFEIRCKIPSIGKLWPAFWLYGECGQEIDVFEFMSENTNPYYANRDIAFTYHRHFNCNDTGYPPFCNFNKKYPAWTTDMSLAFHTYSVEWDEHMLIWRIDGNEVARAVKWHTLAGAEMTKCGQIAYANYVRDKIYPLEEPMRIIANNSTRDNPTATLPANLEIDYIKVYQKINSQATVSVCSNSDIKGSTVAGKEIVVGGTNCSVTVESDQILDLVATDKITLSSNFNVELGATFSAKIDSQ